MTSYLRIMTSYLRKKGRKCFRYYHLVESDVHMKTKVYRSLSRLLNVINIKV